MNSKRTVGVLLCISALFLAFLYFYPRKMQELPIPEENQTTKNPTKPEEIKQESTTASNDLGFMALNQEISIDALATQGIIPTWLNGSLLRNGPAQFSLNNVGFANFFDGFAMVHRFTFNNGIISYANKFLETKYRTKALKKGKLPNPFQERKKSSWFSAIGKLFTKAPEYDNANTNITRIGNDFAAITETPFYIAFDPQTLQTKGHVVFDDKLEGHLVTAHPLTDTASQETFNILTQYGNTSTYHIYYTKPGSTKRTVLATINTKHPAYMHSFGLTENFIVLMLAPFIVNPFDLMFSDKAFIDNFVWKPEQKTEILLIDRKTGKQISAQKIEPFFFFHTINCFEQNNKLHIDVISYDDHRVVYSQKINLLRETPQPTYGGHVKHITIDFATKKTAVEKKSILFERPRINEKYQGKAYSFAYGTDLDKKQIIKYDRDHNVTISWQEAGYFVGEPIFVAKPGCSHEDDGVILSVVLDAAKKHSLLLILDARSIKELGRAIMPHHIPFDFHGNFYTHKEP
jgi:carotenoid cleavage dioxygenase-like enzyme